MEKHEKERRLVEMEETAWRRSRLSWYAAILHSFALVRHKSAVVGMYFVLAAVGSLSGWHSSQLSILFLCEIWIDQIRW